MTNTERINELLYEILYSIDKQKVKPFDGIFEVTTKEEYFGLRLSTKNHENLASRLSEHGFELLDYRNIERTVEMHQFYEANDLTSKNNPIYRSHYFKVKRISK